MAKRFGINYIIWNRQMWRAYDPGRGWAPYYGVSPHTDHIHFSFNWDGACMRSSWWSGVAVTTPLTGPNYTVPAAASRHHGERLPAARAGRHRPRRRPGAEGHRRHRRRQVRPHHGGRARHVADEARSPRDEGTRQRHVVEDGGAQAHPEPHGNPLAKYVNVVLKRGSTGEAVRPCRRRSAGSSVDGSYGPPTESRVKAYQQSKGLTVTGITDAKVWNALMDRGPTVLAHTAPAHDPTTRAPRLTPAKYSG